MQPFTYLHIYHLYIIYIERKQMFLLICTMSIIYNACPLFFPYLHAGIWFRNFCQCDRRRTCTREAEWHSGWREKNWGAWFNTVIVVLLALNTATAKLPFNKFFFFKLIPTCKFSCSVFVAYYIKKTARDTRNACEFVFVDYLSIWCVLNMYTCIYIKTKYYILFTFL